MSSLASGNLGKAFCDCACTASPRVSPGAECHSYRLHPDGLQSLENGYRVNTVQELFPELMGSVRSSCGGCFRVQISENSVHLSRDGTSQTGIKSEEHKVRN